MGAFGEASIQDVARRVMPCPLPTIARLILAVAVRIVGDAWKLTRRVQPVCARNSASFSDGVM
jgi:hypothetical protein